MDLGKFPQILEDIITDLTPRLEPLINTTRSLPQNREVKSLRRKLLRSYSSLSEAIDIMPDVRRSLDIYQPDVSFNAEEANPNPEQLASIQGALAERGQRDAQRSQMAAENNLAHRLRAREYNRRAGDRRAAFVRGEELLHIDGGTRSGKRRKQRKTKKQRRYRR